MKSLIGLQDYDTRIRGLQARREQGPIKIQELELELKIIEDQQKEKVTQLEAYRRETREAERSIEGLDASMEKSNIKLSNIKSNKEYKAALKEISDLEHEKSVLEEKAIELMERIEEMEKELVVSRARTEAVQKEFEKNREDIQKEMKALEQDLEFLEKGRGQFCQDVDEKLLKTYNSLRDRKKGVAISPVIKGVCQGCHLGIPPQKFNELIRGDEMMNCPNCGRIVYWGEDIRLQCSAEET